MRFRVRLAAAWLALALGVLGGCGSFSPRETLRGRNLDVAYEPSPGSAAFRALALEKTPSVVVLKVEGDDIRTNMSAVSHVLLAKGYLVRDYTVTLEELAKAGLLHSRPLEPETIRKASGLFKETAAIAGTVEVTQLEPLRARLNLAWIDLKTQKTLWTANATYSGYAFGGADRFEAAVREMIERALAPLPPAKP